MSGVSYAEPQDIVNRWRTLSAAELTIAPYLISDASNMLRAEGISYGIDLDYEIAQGNIDADDAMQVVAGMVKRALMIPVEGINSQSETVGPFSLSQTFNNSFRNLFLTAADRTLLFGYQSLGRSVRFYT